MALPTRNHAPFLSSLCSERASNHQERTRHRNCSRSEQLHCLLCKQLHYSRKRITSPRSSEELLRYFPVRAADLILTCIIVPIRPFRNRIPLRRGSLIVDRGQAAASGECRIPDARHARGDRDRGQTNTAVKRPTLDARHATIRRNDAIFTTSY